jgi:hypothetical protein
MDAVESLHYPPRRRLVIEIAGGEEEGAEVARLIRRCQQLGGPAATGQADGLLLPEPFGCLEAVLVQREDNGCHMPQGALGLLAQPCRHDIPDVAPAPSADLGMDRAPWYEARGKVAPRVPRAQDMEASSRPTFQQQIMNDQQ